jgi:hypothetical protein
VIRFLLGTVVLAGVAFALAAVLRWSEVPDKVPMERTASQAELVLHGFDTSHRKLSAVIANAQRSRSGSMIPVGKHPVIAIVIDDLGMDVAATRRAMALPKAVSLSFLPYAGTTPALAREAERDGHQVLAHVPMQPLGTADPGPDALVTGLSPDETRRRLDWDLSRVPGFAGINNHMGSRFTSDRESLVPVVKRLAESGGYFLDSRTTAASAVVPLARAFGVRSADRDVFLDDKENPDAVLAQLNETERKAREAGVAIAIGHPHATTLAMLETWLPRARARGIDFVPAGKAIRLKTELGATPPVTSPTKGQ